MTMGLQDLMMFRDNLQQPTPTGMDNLRNLQALTMQGMAAEDYMNEPQPMMMNTGLMSLPVAQAGFGGFVKSIAKGVKNIGKGVVKGVSGLAKGVAGAVKNIAGSPIGQFAIPAAAMFFAPQLGITSLLGKSALAGSATGLTSLLGGAKPKDALKRAALAGALTYGGGKLFGAGGAGAPKGPTSGNFQGFNPNAPGAKALLDSGSYSQVGQAQLAQGGLQPQFAVGDAGTGLISGVAPAPTAGSVGVGATTNIGPASYQGATVGVQPEFPVGNVAADQAALNASMSPLTKIQSALASGVQKVKDLPLPQKLLLGTTAVSALGAGQPIPQQQLAMAGLTPVETDFDKQVFTYRDTQGNILTTEEALRRIQEASQGFGSGGQQVASGVRVGFDRVAEPRAGSKPLGSVEELGKFAVDTLQQPLLGSQSGGMVDPMLSASGGLIGMMYGGQTMPENNMDVKYKEFSGMVGGRGDGMEDNVYMPIVEGESGQQVATLAVSPKEYVVDANTMSLLGNGNPDEGAEIMDKTVKDIRKKATGQTKQQKEIDGLAALNRMRRSV